MTWGNSISSEPTMTNDHLGPARQKKGTIYIYMAMFQKDWTPKVDLPTLNTINCGLFGTIILTHGHIQKATAKWLRRFRFFQKHTSDKQL